MLLTNFSFDLGDGSNNFDVLERIGFLEGEIKVGFSSEENLLIIEFNSKEHQESKLFLLPENDILISHGGIIGLYILYYADMALNTYKDTDSEVFLSDKNRLKAWERDVSEKIRMLKIKELF